MGRNSQATAIGGIARRRRAVADGGGVVEVGGVNQQSFGTASNTYTMAGITSAASRTAQSGPTQLVTSDSAGNLATTTLAGLGLASTTDIAAINSQLANVNGQINDLYGRSSKAYNGIAMAFAMAGVPTLLPHEKLAVTMNYGTFEGTNGLALNAAVRLTESMQFTGGIGYGANEHIAGGRVGLRIGW
jgi:hypothetical protein